MATPLATTFTTTTAKGLKESLSDKIAKVDPMETPLYSMAKKVTIGSRKPEWLEWEVPAPIALDPRSEGEELKQGGGDFAAVTVPIRYINATQVAQRSFSISGTLEAVKLAGGSAIEQQTETYALEVRRDVERFLNANQVVSATEPRINGGLPVWADGGDGTTLNGATVVHTVTDVELAMKNLFDIGVRPNVLMQAPTPKILFSASSKAGTAPTGFQVEMNITDRENAAIPGAVSVYLTDLGSINCVVNVFVGLTDDTGNGPLSFLFDSRKVHVGAIKDRSFKVERLGKTGDAHQVMILFEGALMPMSPKSIATVV